MKKLINYIAAGLFLSMAPACTDTMEEMQVSDKALEEKYLLADALNVSSFIPTLAYNVNNVTTSWQYQVEQNLNADHFAGYMMSANPFGLSGTNAHYNMNDGWNGFIYSVPAANLGQMVAFKRDALPLYNDYYSYGLILKVLSALPMVDAFGTFPYTQFGTGTDVEWDDLETIYEEMVSEMTYAADNLSAYIGTEKVNRISNDPSSYAGDYMKLIKLANTIKLRLAMRMSEVAPSRAQSIAEEAVNHQNGVLESGDGVYEIIGENNHPLWQLGAWIDTQMGADMESFLGGYDDPRLAEYFSPATDAAVEGQYKGIRQGASIKEKSTYEGFSLPNFEQNAPMVLVTVAEAYFLRAEGALKGWNMGGTAEELYKAGVTASFSQYGLENVDDYLANSLTPADYVDPKNAANNYLATTDVTPNWSDATNDEERLEKIITQKWIAIFPDGAEAWADFRRTGYPKLKPIPASQNPNITTGDFIKKVPIPSNVSGASEGRYNEAVTKYFNGNDNAGVRVWWDVD